MPPVIFLCFVSPTPWVITGMGLAYPEPFSLHLYVRLCRYVPNPGSDEVYGLANFGAQCAQPRLGVSRSSPWSKFPNMVIARFPNCIHSGMDSLVIPPNLLPRAISYSSLTMPISFLKSSAHRWHPRL